MVVFRAAHTRTALILEYPLGHIETVNTFPVPTKARLRPEQSRKDCLTFGILCIS